MDLAKLIDGAPSTPLALRQGVVTQVSPLLVRVGAAATAAPAVALGSYAPTVDDVVSVLEQGADRLVLGPAAGGVGIPGVRARPTGAQSLATGANTYLAWATEDYDTHTFHDNSTNNSRLTVPAGLGGTYTIGFSVLFASGTQTTAAWVEVNRAATRFAWVQTPNDTTNGTLLVGVDFLRLSAGDYVEVRAFQNSGGALNVNGNTSCSFWMKRDGN